jgi:hypothetical protein
MPKTQNFNPSVFRVDAIVYVKWSMKELADTSLTTYTIAYERKDAQ